MYNELKPIPEEDKAIIKDIRAKLAEMKCTNPDCDHRELDKDKLNIFSSEGGNLRYGTTNNFCCEHFFKRYDAAALDLMAKVFGV